MNRVLALAAIICVVVFPLLFAAPAQAQATRTWVSGVGDDANPCSRTAPCKTFAGAISKTAAGGEIDVLDPGGFGALTITKAITIDGGGSYAGVLVAGTPGFVVAAGASDVVTLRNLEINGINQAGNAGTDGVRFISGGSLHLEHVVIYGFSNAGVNIVATSPSTSPQFFLTNVSAHSNGTGVWIQPAGVVARVSVFNSKISDNNFGLRADSNSVVGIKNSQVTGNANSGVQASPTGGPATISVDGSLIAFNFNGFIAQGPGIATIFISNNTITSNVNRSLGTTGGSVISFGNNAVSNNGVNTPPTSTIATQ
jgi:hypothetical protein